MNKQVFYDFNLERVVSEVIKANARRVLIQLPNGMKNYISYIINHLKEKLKGNVELFVSTSHTYGACDIAEDEALRIGADLIVHFGHTPHPLYPKPKVRTLFIEAFIDIKPSASLIDKLVDKLRNLGLSRVGLAASLQYIKYINHLALELEEKNFTVIVGRSKYENLMYPGQVLGCEYSCMLNIENRVDGFIVVSGGKFHQLGASLITSKPVIGVDPHREEVYDMNSIRNVTLRKRYYKIMKAMDAKNWGIILGMKPGQFNYNAYRELINLLNSRGKEYIVFTANEINQHILRNIDTEYIDVFVVIACPRVVIDDLADYPKPVLTLGEAFMALTGRLDKYLFR